MQPKMSVEELHAFLATEFPQVGDDYSIQSVSAMEITVRLNVAERHQRPGGTVSGPAMFALADVSVYLAILSMIGPKALAVTTNTSIDFMRKPQAGKNLLAVAKLNKLGRVLAVGQVLVYSEGQDEPVAQAALTYSIPPSKT